MDRARLAGVALVLLGVGLLVGATAAWPRPTWMEGVDPGAPAPAAVLARGPAIARYDEANDTTFAAFECVHWYCDHAVAIRGDARESVAQDGVLLRPVEPGRILATRPLDPTLLAHSMVVSTAFDATFDLAPRFPGLVARMAGVAAAVAGAALALGSWRGAVGAAGSGLIVLAGLATSDGSAVILLQLAGVPLSLVAAGVLAAVRSTRAWWPAPATYLPVLVGVLASGALSFVPTDGA